MNKKLCLAIILMPALLPSAALSISCSSTSPYAVTVRNLTGKTLWVNMGNEPSKGKEGLVFGYKVIESGADKAVCFKLGIRGAGMWVREADHNDALFFPLGDKDTANAIRGKVGTVKTIEIIRGAGFVPARSSSKGVIYKWQVMEGGEQKIANKVARLIGKSVAWVDYIGFDTKGYYAKREGRGVDWFHGEQDPEKK